jgi:hypothetical protein
VPTERWRDLKSVMISFGRGRDVHRRGLPFKEDEHVFVVRQIENDRSGFESINGDSTLSTDHSLYGRRHDGLGGRASLG